MNCEHPIAPLTAVIEELSAIYHNRYRIRPRMTDEFGEESQGFDLLDQLSSIKEARRHALQESIRWGEPYIYFLGPGIISWIVPMLQGRETLGGLVGGEVLAQDEAADRLESINHLVSIGGSRQKVEEYIGRLPSWPLSRIQEAAAFLFDSFYQLSGWSRSVLDENREKATQQRQIAEEIHRRKRRGLTRYPVDQERVLISLIRAGDRKAARRLLNQLVGAMFLRSGNLVVVRALMIELIGYLTRSAVEESTFLESLVEKNLVWTEEIVKAADFEELAHTLAAILDEFMTQVFLMGYQPVNRSVRRALDYLGEHFRERISLKDVAAHVALSPYRLAHLIKADTGKTVGEHILHLRIREARRLLEETTDSCADIAYRVGFCDQSYFTKQFKRHMGITPASHRRLHWSTSS